MDCVLINIEIGGRSRPWLGNQMTMEVFSKKVSLESWTTTSEYAAVYAGLKAGCYPLEQELTHTVDGKEVLSTFADVCKWVDDLYVKKDVSVILKVKEAFETCNAYMDWIEKIKDKLHLSSNGVDDKRKKKQKTI